MLTFSNKNDILLGDERDNRFFMFKRAQSRIEMTNCYFSHIRNVPFLLEEKVIMIDLIKKKFGRLSVIKRNGLLSNGKENLKAWECICDCGNKTIVRGRDLITGNTKSCGCLFRENLSRRTKTHGMSGTHLYKLWIGIKKRCSNNKYQYRFYKNISICKKWNRFENFYDWAKNKYTKGLDIDRINTLKEYSPNNCRFITRKKNAQNKKNCKEWHISGSVFESAYDAAKYFGVVQSTIVSWCMGKKSGKYNYPPKVNCYAIKKYKENYANN